MSIIKSHNITLYGGNDEYKIILRPLSDNYLPLLYKWNSDPEVLYWSEVDDVNENSPEVVHQIYGGISQNNLCFAIEVNGKTIGECWLQKMNLPQVKAMYDENLDVRRIDMCIGEKDYWGKGIGTLLISMLVDFAFNKEKVDVLHCMCEDYNIRSKRVWEKNSFTLALEEKLPQPQKGKIQYHWRLTKEVYEKYHRENLCYCGHDCSKCVTYIATQRNDDNLRRQSQSFYKENFGLDIPLEKFNCNGGRSGKVFELCKECPFIKCCKQHDIDSCSKCPEYPCKNISDYQAKYVNKCNQI